ncbi:MAG: FmdB family zinc ribbon protein [Candidatus Hydrogenedentota bacterium]
MPTYTYSCKKCGHAFDVFHAMSASPRIKCEECGSLRTERLLGAGAGFIFKGSGFYETDFKEKKGVAPKTDSKNGKSEAASSGDGAGSAKKGQADAKPGGSEKAESTA